MRFFQLPCTGPEFDKTKALSSYCVSTRPPLLMSGLFPRHIILGPFLRATSKPRVHYDTVGGRAWGVISWTAHGSRSRPHFMGWEASPGQHLIWHPFLSAADPVRTFCQDVPTQPRTRQWNFILHLSLLDGMLITALECWGGCRTAAVQLKFAPTGA